MSWLLGVLLVVLRDQRVQRAFRALLIAVLAAASAALGLGALLLPTGEPPFEWLSSPLLSQ